MSGGIFIFLGILYSYDINFLYFFIFSFLILILGFFSDLKLIKSAILRLIMQISLVILFVSITDLKIQDTRIFLLDELLENMLFNCLFVSFCILILINGSNFIDGLNTLNIGYYLIIGLVIYYLKFQGFEIYLNNLFFFIIHFINNFYHKYFQ